MVKNTHSLALLHFLYFYTLRNRLKAQFQKTNLYRKNAFIKTHKNY